MPVMRGWSSVERDVARSITRVCAAGLDSVSLRRALLRHLGRLIPADASFFNVLDPETGLVTHAMGEGAPPELPRRYFGFVYPEVEAAGIIDLARSGEVIARSASPELQRLFASVGLERELRATFAVGDEPWGILCAVRERSAPPFGERERAFLCRIAPAVGRALRTAALRELAGMLSGVERGAEDDGVANDPAPGVVVVDACGRLMQRTPAAAAQLADLADVSRDAGDLLDGDLPSAIRSVLARPRADRPRDEDTAPRELRARGRSGRWYTIRAMLTEPDASGCSNTIVLIAPLERRALAPLLAKLYGLSPREREVLTLVARGYSTKEIAARLRISSYTVQEHLGHASDKVGVRGRRALLARLFFDGYAERLHG